MSGLLVAAVLWGLHITMAQDYCSLNNFPRRDPANRMAFRKELSQTEFVYLGEFKSLHCCVDEFRTVEWFKEGQAYPWTGNVSSLIINPASHNQTIYSQAVSFGDSGDYYCIASNETHHLKHNVHLQVTSAGFVGAPKATYRPQRQYQKLGGTTRFYCEAFVGNIELPDARSDVVWTRLQNNFTADPNERHKQTLISRDEKQIYGSFLTISNIRPEDFGTYYCTVSNTGDQFLQITTELLQDKEISIEWTDSEDITLGVCLGVVFLCISATIIVFMTYRFQLQWRLCWKTVRERIFPVNAQDEVDVSLVYHEQDASTVLAYMAPTLQHTYGYTCHCSPLPTTIPLRKIDIEGKRLLVIVSRYVTQNTWTAKSVSEALQSFLLLHSKVICIFLEELPAMDARTVEGRFLQDTLERVHYLTHTEVNDTNFWTKLQLGLPHHKKARAKKNANSLENLM